MFLGLLSERQKSAFVYLAQRMIDADKVISAKENRLLNQMKEEMGLFSRPYHPNSSQDDLIAAFDDRQSRMVALIELTLLGHADNSFSAPENAVLKDLARRWEMGEKELAAAEGWVARHLALVAEAHRLWES